MQTRPILKSARVAVGATLLAAVFGSTAMAVPADKEVDTVRSDAPRAVVADAAPGSAGHDANGTELAQSRNAARSRMRECGHQWSSMKKNGSAAGMTWKDFSQGCLAKQ